MKFTKEDIARCKWLADDYMGNADVEWLLTTIKRLTIALNKEKRKVAALELQKKVGSTPGYDDDYAVDFLNSMFNKK